MNDEKLDEILERFDVERDYLEAKYAIESIIRTEKLKLLAEVRERVVGEDHQLYGSGEDWEGAEPQNSLKEDQRDLLTQLEAEL